MKKLLLNFIYQALTQLLTLLMPILTVPLVSHALGPHQLGIYNYTFSIINYCVLLSALGISLYGQNQIARVREDKEKLSQLFNELIGIKLIATIISLMIAMILTFNSQFKEIMLIETLFIIASFFDITWFFMGIENFKAISIRSILIKLTTLVLIIVFVRTPQDLVKYVLIMTIGTLFSQLIMWPFLRGLIIFKIPSLAQILSHGRNLFMYFVPQLGVMLYTNLNTTILGFFSTPKEVAYFTNAGVIALFSTMLVGVLDTVLLSRLSNMESNNNKKQMMNLLNMSLNVQFFISIPIMFGVIIVSKHLVPWFFGTDYLFIRYLLPIMSLRILFSPIATAISKQYFIPTGNIQIYNKVVFVGVAINIIINIIAVPKFHAIASTFSLVFTEIFISISMLYLFLKETNFKYDKTSISKWFFSGVVMLFAVSIITWNMPSNFVTTLFQIFFGIIIYNSVSIILNVNPIWNRVIKKIY